MQKLSTMMIVLLAGASLAGCYSKSCDTACPRGEKMQVTTLTATPKTVQQKAAPAAKTTPAAKTAPAQDVPPVNDTAPAPASD